TTPTAIAKSDTQARVRLTAAADAALGVRELRLVAPSGITAPVTVLVGQYPGRFEKEPNNAAENATPVEFTASLGGRIDAPGDVDLFRFDATKGQHVLFNVYASRIASKLEPVVTIRDAGGRELPQAESHQDGDPLVAFDVPADGPYLLHIRDLQYRGGP